MCTLNPPLLPPSVITQISVLATSHIGGHKYAGNVIAYSAMHPCDGDWFGGVNASNAAEFLDALLGVEVSLALRWGVRWCLGMWNLASAGQPLGWHVLLLLAFQFARHFMMASPPCLACSSAWTAVLRTRRCGPSGAAAWGSPKRSS